MLHRENKIKAYHTTSAADLLKETMAYYGITQADLASRIGVSQKNVSDILNHKRYLTPTLVMRIEIVTGISGQLLLTLDDNYNLNLVEHEKDVSEHHSPLYLKRYDWVTS